MTHVRMAKIKAHGVLMAHKLLRIEFIWVPNIFQRRVVQLSIGIDEHPRMKREKKTIEAMVHIYCEKKHDTKGELCAECSAFLEYANLRLDRCPFQEKKTTCAHCPIHCYQPEKRQKAKEIMRYAGPRMLTRHPVLALHHLWDGRKKPEKPTKK